MKAHQPTQIEMGMKHAPRYNHVSRESMLQQQVQSFLWTNKLTLDKIWEEIEVLCVICRELQKIEYLARLEYLTTIYCNVDATKEAVIVYKNAPLKFYELVENLYPDAV